MSTTLAPEPTLPRNDLGARLQYQTTCNRFMATTGAERPGGSAFTAGEMRAMDFAYTAGITPATFVEVVLQQRAEQ